MDFTFGICVIESNKDYHQQIIDSIKNLNIPSYEILFIGSSSCQNSNVRLIEFDENSNPGWITRKKNILAQESKYENLVLCHDYFVFEQDWYNGFLKHGNDFSAIMNKIVDPDNERFVDWLVLHEDIRLPNAEQLLPYDWIHCSNVQYLPGFYFVAKKDFMLQNPLSENLFWGQAEDVEWSRRVRQKINFSINPHSTVKMLKHKDYKFREMSDLSKEIMHQYGF